jgi:triose/dihydroxyacetone kinase / FAD-AMP lyase (cyclizing)
MSHFVNRRDAVVTEAIEGFLSTSRPGALARLDGFPDVKVVVRADWDRSKVAIVSGGGSGHEPAHAGFVGRGALTAAVCGDIFASPTVHAVYSAIVAVSGPSGCLLIVKNYAGDRLNFGLAAERARADGLKVEMVIVADDVALDNFAQPRGIAGTLFVHKVAGSAAEAGAPLEQVAAEAARAAKAVKSLGIATTVCTIPGQQTHARLNPGQAELGLGIHGEPGVERIELPLAGEVATMMAARLSRVATPTGAVALLVNNLGGTPDLEMGVFCHSLLTTPLGRRAKYVLGPAKLMTALDMKGVSVSVLPLDDALAAALMTDCDAPAWPEVNELQPIKVVAMPRAAASVEANPSDDPRTREAVTAICHALLTHEAQLNALDAKVGDGDTGTTFATAARTVLSAIDALPLAEPDKLCAAVGKRLSEIMGGTSGVLLSIFAAAAGRTLASGADWAVSLREGVNQMQFYGGADPGDRTMLDAFVPAIAALERGEDCAAAARAARDGAEATARMIKAHAGRSSYLAETELKGVADPGAVAVAAAFSAAASVLARRATSPAS